VIFENELIQLIQYAPQTSEVEKTPLLIVPPCINKYYLLDLGAGNSLVEYAVAQGHQVFLISWRSAVPDTGHLTWDDYLELGPLRAIDVILDITGAKRTHALGFCVGGTITSCAAAVLAARQQDKLATLSTNSFHQTTHGATHTALLEEKDFASVTSGAIGAFTPLTHASETTKTTTPLCTLLTESRKR